MYTVPSFEDNYQKNEEKEASKKLQKETLVVPSKFTAWGIWSF